MSIGWWWTDDIHNESLTVIRVTGRGADDYGTPIQKTKEVHLHGYSVEPVGSNESVGNEQLVTTRWRVSGPLTDAPRDHDRVRWRGRELQIEGEPQHFHASGHTEFFLTTQKG